MVKNSAIDAGLNNTIKTTDEIKALSNRESAFFFTQCIA